MVDAQLVVIKEAVNKGQGEAITAVAELAREWAGMVEANNLDYTPGQALRFFADTIQKQWAATGAGVAHAAE